MKSVILLLRMLLSQILVYVIGREVRSGLTRVWNWESGDVVGGKRAVVVVVGAVAACLGNEGVEREVGGKYL